MPEPEEVIEQEIPAEEMSAADADAAFDEAAAGDGEALVPADEKAVIDEQKAAEDAAAKAPKDETPTPEEIAAKEAAEAEAKLTPEEKSAREASVKVAEEKAEAEAKVAEETAAAEAKAKADAAKVAAEEEATAAAKAAEEAAKPKPIAETIAALVEKHGAVEVFPETEDPAVTLADFNKDYPSLMPVMATVVQEMLGPLADQVKGIQPVIESQQQAAFESERTGVFGQLAEDHPDAAEIYASDDFNAKVDAWPQWKQDVANQMDPAAARQALEWYKAEANIETPTSEAKAKAEAKAEKIKADQKAANEKANRVGGASLRTKKTPAPKPVDGEDGPIDEDEADRIFEEESAKEDV